jgi:hypothetical protein
VNVGYRHLARVPPTYLHIPVLGQLPPAEVPLGRSGSIGSSHSGMVADYSTGKYVRAMTAPKSAWQPTA